MILLMSGNPTSRRALLDMANLMTKKYGLLFLAHIAQPPILYKTKQQITLSQKEWLRSKDIHAFYRLLESDSLSNGTKSMMQVFSYHTHFIQKYFLFSQSFTFNPYLIICAVIRNRQIHS